MNPKKINSLRNYRLTLSVKKLILLFCPMCFFPMKAKFIFKEFFYLIYTPKYRILFSKMLLKLIFRKRLLMSQRLHSMSLLYRKQEKYIFGYPYAGISNEETDSYVSELIYKKNLENIKSIDGSLYVVGALSENGEIYVWGTDNEGLIKEANVDLPNGQFEIIPEPVKLDYQNITQFCIGRCDGTAISENGDVYIWGSNSIGQIIEFE